jgi:hypothetical protein
MNIEDAVVQIDKDILKRAPGIHRPAFNTDTEVTMEKVLEVKTTSEGMINRAWGLALRKRFCRSFNFELQAAATDDAIVISLGTQHSFPWHSASA